MSHPEQLAFLRLVVDSNPAFVAGKEIIEIGSYDVNGTVRALFGDAARYIGVDVVPGPGVDVVSFGHLLDLPDASFDLAVSAECLEHDPHWRATFATMVRLTRPSGLVCITCATRGRPEHGTSRTRSDDSPGSREMLGDYYLNLTVADFKGLPLASWFSRYRFFHCRSNSDLYLVGQRAGLDTDQEVHFPDGEQMRRIDSLMDLPRRAVRWPARALAMTPISERRFQDLVVPWWTRLQRMQAR